LYTTQIDYTGSTYWGFAATESMAGQSTDTFTAEAAANLDSDNNIDAWSVGDPGEIADTANDISNSGFAPPP
jgi:hypothetical protein